MGGSTGRLGGWTFALRTHYASVWGGVGVVVVLGLPVALGSLSIQCALLLVIPCSTRKLSSPRVDLLSAS